MKKTLRLAVFAGGALVGFGSLIPLTSYAAGNQGNAEVTAVVNSAITLDTATGFSTTGDAGSVMIGEITTKVTANTKYAIGIKTATSETSMKATTSSEEILASANVVAGTNAWGVKKLTDANGNALSDAGYTAVTTENQAFYVSTGKSVDGGDSVNFPVGISTSSSITAGTYSIDLTITASAAQ